MAMTNRAAVGCRDSQAAREEASEHDLIRWLGTPLSPTEVYTWLE